MQMTEIVKTNWLSEIDGLTVEKAIEYLKTLNPNNRLQTSLDGDTHGVELSSYLENERPATEAEIDRYKQRVKQNKIMAAKQQVDYMQRKLDVYLNSKNQHYIDMYTQYLADAKAKLQKLLDE